MASHSSTLAWKILWMEEPGRLQSMGSLRVGYDWMTSLSLFTFMHWRRKWQPTPVFSPGESQGRGSLVGCHLWGRRVGHNWSDLAAAAVMLGFAIQQHESVICCCSVAKSCLTLCDTMDCSTPGFSVLHYLQEFAQIHVHWVDDNIQSSHPLPPPSSFAFDLSQHQGLFQWVSSLHQVALVLELRYQFFQWMFKVDFL